MWVEGSPSSTEAARATEAFVHQWLVASQFAGGEYPGGGDRSSAKPFIAGVFMKLSDYCRPLVLQDRPGDLQFALCLFRGLFRLLYL